MSPEDLRFGRLRVVFLGFLGALLLIPGGALAAGGEGEDRPPAIAAGEVSPASLSYAGGNVQIRAEVVDDVGVSTVFAQVYGPEGSNQYFQLFEGYENNYFGTLEVPANGSESAVGYEVEIQVYDLANNYVSTTIGGVQVEGAPQFDESPYVSETSLTPSFLPAEGGAVTIAAQAGDNRALTGIFATVALPGGGSKEVPLSAVDFNRFEGSFEVPPNAGPLAAEYLVEVVVEDDLGQQSRASAGTITVEAPPPPPSPGLLEAWPSDRSFGLVQIGKTARRTVFVRDLPRRGGGPVGATVRLAGSSDFHIAGAASTGLHLDLAPGQKREVTVEFRPTAAGTHLGRLEIARDDGRQPDLAVDLAARAK
jgi:hypothetical protein